MIAMRAVTVICLAVMGSGLEASGLDAAEWPQFGGSAGRNMVSEEKGLPDLHAEPGETSTVLTSPGSPYVKWSAKVGATTWGNPTVSGGRVFVGTSGRGGEVKCFDCATGRLVWQLVAPPRKFPTPERPKKFDRFSSWDYLVATQGQNTWGICSSATVDGDRAYVLTQRGEVVCLDVHGLADGNQGPFTDEARYKSGDGGPPAQLEPTDADILWICDLWTQLTTRPADTFSNSGLIDGNLLYLSTCNGIERWPQWHGKAAQPPNSAAANLVVLDKRSGRLVATDAETIGTRMLHGQWSSPSSGKVNGKTLIFYGGGDGVCYAFEALSGTPEQPVKLKKVWSYDCNPPEYKGIGVQNYSLGDKDVVHQAPVENREEAGRQRQTHVDREGRLLAMSEIIASPVFHGNRVYVAIGRDPRHGPGRGALHCIDATQTGDITGNGPLWCYQDIDRSLSTVSVADGLVYAADVAGRLHCVDADTGRCYWTHAAAQETWGSPLVADGKVYLVTRKSFLVFAAGKEKKLLATVRMGGECSPIAANGTLYVVLRGTLYALQSPHGSKPTTLPDKSSAEQPPAHPGRDAESSSEASEGRSEWPGWRGPRGDGFSPEVPRRLPPKKLLWTRAMAGECHAPLSVAEGCVVAADNDGRRDYWRCFADADGTPRWTYEYPNAEKMDFGAGPRAAPRIYRGKAYCLNAWGELFCLELASGRLVWKKHLAREFQQKTPTWGYTCSPLVANGNLIVNPGGAGGPVAALDPPTGNVIWTGKGEGVNYSSFILGTFGGVEQVVGYDKKTAGGWDAKTGRRLWTLAVDASYGYIVPSLVAVGGRLLLTSDQEDARLLGFTPSGTIAEKPMAENADFAAEVSTPCVWGSCILGVHSGLLLLDPASADSRGQLKTLWSHEEDCLRGVCHAIVSDDRALVMCENGQLLLLAADRQACKILDRMKLCNRTWVHPALANGRLYVRDRAEISCYLMRDSGPAP